MVEYLDQILGGIFSYLSTGVRELCLEECHCTKSLETADITRPHRN